MELNLTVNQGKLSDDLESIPNEILVWSRESADRLANQQKAEASLRLVEAELSLKIRQNPVNYGHQKVTENLVDSLVVIQPEYQQAEQALIAAKHEANTSRGIVDALEVKRSSLKYLAELTVAGYLGSMTVAPRGIRNNG